MTSGIEQVMWLQSVAYYLTRGSTKREMLVNFLMEFHDAFHNARLVVDANIAKALETVVCF
jgi:hypothetical protein